VLNSSDIVRDGRFDGRRVVARREDEVVLGEGASAIVGCAIVVCGVVVAIVAGFGENDGRVIVARAEAAGSAACRKSTRRSAVAMAWWPGGDSGRKKCDVG
jgi:hypothetical protein